MSKRRSGRSTAAMAVAAALLATSQLAGQAGQKAAAAPKPAQVERGEGGPKRGDWESAFRALPAAANIRAYDERLSARPHHVGSPYDKDNAEWMLAQFKEWGWDATIERFDVLFPTPKDAAARDGRADAVHGEARGAGGAGRSDLERRRPSSFPPTTPTRSTATSPRRSST